MPDAPDSERVTLAPGLDVLIRPIRPEDRKLMAQGLNNLSPEARFQRFFAPVDHFSESDLTYLTEIDHRKHEALVAIDPEDGSLVGVARYVCITRPGLGEGTMKRRRRKRDGEGEAEEETWAESIAVAASEEAAEAEGTDPRGSGPVESDSEVAGDAKGGSGDAATGSAEDPADVRGRGPTEAEVAVIVGDPWQGKGLATALLQRLARRASEEGIDYFLAIVLEDNDGATGLFKHLVEDASEVTDGEPGTVEIRIELPGPESFSESVLARALSGSARGSLRVAPWRRLQRRLIRNRQGRKPGEG